MNFIHSLIYMYNPDHIRRMHRLYDRPIVSIGEAHIEVMQKQGIKLTEAKKRSMIEAANQPGYWDIGDAVPSRHRYFPGLNIWGETGPIGYFREKPYPYACAKVDFIRSRHLDPELLKEAIALVKGVLEVRNTIQTGQNGVADAMAYSFYTKHPLEYFFTKRVIEAKYQAEDRKYHTWLRIPKSQEELNIMFRELYPENFPRLEPLSLLEMTNHPEYIEIPNGLFRQIAYDCKKIFEKTFDQIEAGFAKDLEGDAFREHGFLNFDAERIQAFTAYEKRFVKRRALVKRICLIALAIITVGSTTYYAGPQVYSHTINGIRGIVGRLLLKP
jgi:hypothetical protein